MNKDLNINIGSIKTSLLRLPQIFKKYVVEIFAVFVVAIYGFLAFQINSFSSIAADEDKVAEQKQILKRPQIDEESINKIEQLQDHNVAVQSLFKAARDNPFADN